MPPKPKGLKASKRAAPFDPASVSQGPTASTSGGGDGSSISTPPEAKAPSASSERTYPLDEDCLTLVDLYELRLTVLELLYPFPTDLFVRQSDPEKLDEARSFLRGILHGCAVLEQYVRQTGVGENMEKDQEGPRSDDKVDQRRKEAGDDKLEALGLRDIAETEGLLLYLQAWSLHHLGELFEDPKQEIKSAALKLGGGGGAGPSKKRKIDLNEPRTKAEWLEAAYSKYKLAAEGICWAYACDGGEDESIMTLTVADYVRCRIALARNYFESGQEEKGKELAKDCGHQGLGDNLYELSWSIGTYESPCFEVGDAVLAQIRAWAESIPLIESYPLDEREDWQLKLVEPSPKGDKDLWHLHLTVQALTDAELEDNFDHLEKAEDSKRREQAALLRWLKQVVVADALMVSFIKMEDALEAKYRPEEDGDEDDEDNEGEGEVKELPMDSDDVKLVQKASKQAIDALRATIEAFASLPTCFAHPAGKDAQYRKLEEVLLISSALVNPSDKEGTLKIEEEIETLRKEGGLDEDEGGGPDLEDEQK